MGSGLAILSVVCRLVRGTALGLGRLSFVVRWVASGQSTTAISGGAQRQGIRTWHFLWGFECGASWTAVAVYLPPKAELFLGFAGWA
jgi:hypothetical protein